MIDFGRIETMLIADEGGDDSMDFSIGATVRLKEDSRYYEQSGGGEGVITRINPGSTWISVRWENSFLDSYPISDLILSEGLQVGDKVVMLSTSEFTHQCKPGEVGEIIEITSLSNNYPYKVKWEQSSTNVYGAEDLELVDEETEETSSLLYLVPGQVVIIEGDVYALLPLSSEITRLVIRKDLRKESIAMHNTRHFVNLSTRKITLFDISEIDEITDGFVNWEVFSSNGERYIVFQGKQPPVLEEHMRKGNSIKYVGEFTEEMFLQMLSFRNN